jgi:YNFM family putative membrane transporter
LGVLLIGCFFLLGSMKKDANLNYTKPRPRDVVQLILQPCYLWLYLSIFLVFFVFAGTLNFLPFALMQLDSPPSETGIGSMYTGYIMGVVVSLNVRRIIAFFRRETNAVIGGLIIYLLGTLGFMVESYQAMFVCMFVFCTGMFTAHSILSGYVNTLSDGKKGIANGVYISFYYMGGTIGSFAPGVIFQYLGWKPFVGALALLIVVCGMCVKQLQHHVEARSQG